MVRRKWAHTHLPCGRVKDGYGFYTWGWQGWTVAWWRQVEVKCSRVIRSSAVLPVMGSQGGRRLTLGMKQSEMGRSHQNNLTVKRSGEFGCHGNGHHWDPRPTAGSGRRWCGRLPGPLADGCTGFKALARALSTGGMHPKMHFASEQDMTTKYTTNDPPRGSPATHSHTNSWLALLEKITYREMLNQKKKKKSQAPNEIAENSQPIVVAEIIVLNLSIKLSCPFIDCKHQFLSPRIISWCSQAHSCHYRDKQFKPQQGLTCRSILGP